MNKQRILIVAMVLAAAIAAALLFVPGLKGSGLARFVYFPSVFLAVVFSWGAHSPGYAAWHSAFASWSISYLFLVVVLYALGLELYLLVRTTWSMGWPREVVGAAPEEVDNVRSAGGIGFGTGHTREAGSSDESEALMAHLGQKLQAHERRRRSHWLLTPREIDLGAAPADAARKALDTQVAPRAIAWLQRRLEAHGNGTIGAHRARQAMVRTFGKRR